MNQKIITELNEGIDLLNQLPDSDLKKSYLAHFTELKKAWESQDPRKAQLAATQVLQESFIKSSQGIDPHTRKAVEKNKILSSLWAQSFTDISDSERPVNKYADPFARKTKEAEYVSALKKHSKKELLELIASLIVESEIESDWQLVLYNENAFLRESFLQSLERRTAKGANTSPSLSTRYKGNDEILKKIYAKALLDAQNKEQLVPTYRQFKRKVEELKTKPAFKKIPRLTREEKTYPQMDQDYLLAEKKSEGFADATLRNFYESQTGKKATTQK